jgi:CheY-like chemotaxis protein
MGHNIKILFVEDNLSNRFLLKMTLKHSAYDFQFAENGEEALKKINENDFDIIFLDLHLPDIDGFEVAARIRSFKDPLKRDIPIISMSADEPVLDEIKRNFTRAGITGYIKKPFSEEDIDKKIIDSLSYPKIKNHLGFFSINNNSIPASAGDKSHLVKIAKGDPFLIRNMIDILIRQKEESFIKFEKALLTKDWEVVENTAHSLKSSIVFFGMEVLFDTMAKIEKYAMEKRSFEEIRDLIEMAKSGFNKSVEELNKTYQT